MYPTTSGRLWRPPRVAANAAHDTPSPTVAMPESNPSGSALLPRRVFRPPVPGKHAGRPRRRKRAARQPSHGSTPRQPPLRRALPRLVDTRHRSRRVSHQLCRTVRHDRPHGTGRTLYPAPGRTFCETSTGSLHMSVAGPGRLVESGPELHTELVRPRAGVHGSPLATRPLSDGGGFRPERHATGMDLVPDGDLLRRPVPPQRFERHPLLEVCREPTPSSRRSRNFGLARTGARPPTRPSACRRCTSRAATSPRSRTS